MGGGVGEWDIEVIKTVLRGKKQRWWERVLYRGGIIGCVGIVTESAKADRLWRI